jgi:hypothetical protein
MAPRGSDVKRDQDLVKRSTHHASGVAENGRERMKDSHNRVETVDQLSISIAIILELFCFDLKEIEDIIGRLAALERLGEGIVGEVYPGLLR